MELYEIKRLNESILFKASFEEIKNSKHVKKATRIGKKKLDWAFSITPVYIYELKLSDGTSIMVYVEM